MKKNGVPRTRTVRLCAQSAKRNFRDALARSRIIYECTDLTLRATARHNGRTLLMGLHMRQAHILALQTDAEGVSCRRHTLWYNNARVRAENRESFARYTFAQTHQHARVHATQNDTQPHTTTHDINKSLKFNVSARHGLPLPATELRRHQQQHGIIYRPCGACIQHTNTCIVPTIKHFIIPMVNDVNV